MYGKGIKKTENMSLKTTLIDPINIKLHFMIGAYGQNKLIIGMEHYILINEIYDCMIIKKVKSQLTNSIFFWSLANS